ncbi:MAG: nucleotidyltransferase domain-containing protein, partial [Bacteroidia bacterium]
MNTILHDKEAESKLNYLRENNLIIFECIVGSQAYGTAIEGSDEDKKFIYIEPLECILSNTSTSQLNVNKDYVGYEIGRFCELIAKGNPNMLDLLNTPSDCIISISPLYKRYFENNMSKFLTKSVKTAFGDYANAQINKATGENKKQMSPMEKERKGLLDFCWVTSGQQSVPLKDLLGKHSLIHPAMYGVQALDHMKNCYN